MKSINTFIKFGALFALLSVSAFAQSASISGKVTFSDSQNPLHNSTVQIVQLKLTVQTADDGSYKFDNVPPGRYTVLAHFDGFSDSARTIVLVAGANSTVDFKLQLIGVNEQITVTASGTEQSTFDSFQSVNSVPGTSITQRASTSIGEVLDGETGVSKRSFGTGSARPVIRGFDGDRVLVTLDGVRTGSLGSQSGDHGEPIDTLNVERIEVVKGPGTLLYGSNAIGGVVNVISNHENSAHEGLRGYATLLGGTANKQVGTSGGLEYGYKKFMSWGNGSYQNQRDYQTPLGPIPNSASRSASGAVGAGYFADKGFFTGQFNYDSRRFGIPYGALFEAHGHGEEDHDEDEHGGDELDLSTLIGLPPTPDEDIDLDMRSRNIRLTAGFSNLSSIITGGNFSFNFSKYQHKELEIADGIEEVGTVFDNQTMSFRAMFEQRPFQKLTGRFGFEGYNRIYETVGAEQLISGEVKQNNFAFFGLEELNLGRVSFQFGGRVERNSYTPENLLLEKRDFTGFSGAAGIRVGLWEGGAFIANFTSSYRAPALEELYNFGPHVGSVTFEIGDQDLRRERSNGFDVGIRHNQGRVRFESHFFYYRINDFVFLARQDEDGDGEFDIEDGLPVGAFAQGDSEYLGGEFNLDAGFNQYIGMFLSGDVVRAKLTASNLDLPRIPPARLRAGLDFKYKNFNLRPEAVFVGSQDKVYPLETRTAGYGLFNVSANYVIAGAHSAHIFGVNGYNLFNKEYRNHLSLVKDITREMGRGVRFSYTVRFF